MRRVLERAPSMLAYWDRDLRCCFANSAYERWFGVDAQGLVGSSIEDLLGPTLFALNEPHIRAALRGEEQSFQRVVPGPDGVQRQSLAHYLPDVVNGEVQGFVVQVTDITSLKDTEASLRAEAAELERAGALLRKSEATLKQAQRLGRIGNWYWEIRPDITTWSEELYRIFGRDATKLPPSYAEHENIYTAQSWPVLKAAVARTLAYGDPYIIELEYVRPGGATGWLEARGEAERDAHGTIIGLHGTAQEITARVDSRGVQRALAASEHFRDRLEALTPGVVYVFDLERRCSVYINRSIALTLGYSPEEVNDMGAEVVPNLMHPGDRLRFREHLERMRTAEDDETADFEFRMRNRAGAWRWFQSRDAVFSRNEAGEVRELVGTALEIENRKQAEDKLHASEERYRASFAAAPVGIAHIGLDGSWLRFNDAICAITGYEREKLATLTFADITHPDDLEADWAHVRRLLAGETAHYSMEKRYLRESGQTVWADLTVSLLRDAAGAPTNFISVVQDITARKQVEAALHASEEFNRTVLESSPDCVKVLDGEGRLQFMNANGCRLMEIDDFGALRDQPWSVLWPAADGSLVRDAVAKAASGESARFQAFAPTAKGTPKWWDVIVAPAVGAPGGAGAPRLISVTRDITAQKDAEQELRIRDRAIAASDAGVFLVDPYLPDFPIVFASEGFERMTGFAAAEVLGRNFGLLQGIDTDAHAVARLREAVHAHRAVRLAMINYRKDGTPFWNDISISPVTDSNGRVTHLVGILNDVSRLYALQSSLQVSKENLALGVEVAGLALAEVDYATGCYHLTAEAARALGLGRTDMVVPRETVHATFHPDDREELLRRIAGSLDPAGSGLFAMDHRIVWPDGAVRWLTTRKQVLFTGEISSRRPHRATLAMLDVTDKKAAEVALLASHTRMRLAAEATAVGFWEWDVLSDTIRWDAQMFRLYGIHPTPDGVVQYSDWRGAVLPEDLLETERILQNSVLHGGQSRREFRIERREDGEVREIEAVETVRLNERGQAEWVLGTNQDVTERNRAKRRLQQSAAELETEVKLRTAELRELSLHLQTVREDEKASLARELHDELGGLLTAVKLDLARIRVKVAHDPAVVERLEQANNRLNEGIALKRRVIENLRPSALTNLGLAVSLRILCSESSAGLGIPIQAEIEEFSADPDTDLTIYRVLQESLTNISKYARANKVRVRLRTLGETVQLEVTDDGAGFDPNQSSTGRHGITGMRFRVASLGGMLTLDSAPGRGTTLVAAFPLQSITERAGLADREGS